MVEVPGFELHVPYEASCCLALNYLMVNSMGNASKSVQMCLREGKHKASGNFLATLTVFL
jgi:hypothetical protein